MGQHEAVKDNPAKPYKAIVAGLVAFLGTLYANIQGRPDIESLTAQDWLLTIILPTLVTFAGTTP